MGSTAPPASLRVLPHTPGTACRSPGSGLNSLGTAARGTAQRHCPVPAPHHARSHGLRSRLQPRPPPALTPFRSGSSALLCSRPHCSAPQPLADFSASSLLTPLLSAPVKQVGHCCHLQEAVRVLSGGCSLWPVPRRGGTMGGTRDGGGARGRGGSAAGQWASGEEFLCATFPVPLSLLLLCPVTAGALSWLREPWAEGTGQVGSRGEVTTQLCNLVARRRGPGSTPGRACVHRGLSIQPRASRAHTLASATSLPSWVPLSEPRAASCPVSGPGIPIPG